MQFNLLALPAWIKLAAGAAGGLLLVGGAAGVTAAVMGAHPWSGAEQTAASSSPAASPSAAATPHASPSPATKALSAAVLQAEAQVLGLQPKQLRAAIRSGTTLQTLASQQNLTESQFQAQLSVDLKPLLDQDLQQGTISSAQEQSTLNRLGRRIPNWNRTPAAGAKPSPSPTP
ncbi:MAG: hypothetical protein J2P45_30510 [Candidatus Dormibacteraeota bacterium]|nr:hypothetical protein [Candidatus Dormibacteraeota bacterium]